MWINYRGIILTLLDIVNSSPYYPKVKYLKEIHTCDLEKKIQIIYI